jgi:hypothetical protein
VCFLDVTWVCEPKETISTTFFKNTVSENVTLTAVQNVWSPTQQIGTDVSTALPVTVWSGLSDVVMLVDSYKVNTSVYAWAHLWEPVIIVLGCT